MVVCTAQNKVIFFCYTIKIAFTLVTKDLCSRLHDLFKATLKLSKLSFELLSNVSSLSSPLDSASTWVWFSFCLSDHFFLSLWQAPLLLAAS